MSVTALSQRNAGSKSRLASPDGSTMRVTPKSDDTKRESEIV